MEQPRERFFWKLRELYPDAADIRIYSEGNPVAHLRKYRSHKVVRAAKIEKIATTVGGGEVTLMFESGAIRVSFPVLPEALTGGWGILRPV